MVSTVTCVIYAEYEKKSINKRDICSHQNIKKQLEDNLIVKEWPYHFQNTIWFVASNRGEQTSSCVSVGQVLYG